MCVCVVRDATLPSFVDYIRRVIGRARRRLSRRSIEVDLLATSRRDVEALVTSSLPLLLLLRPLSSSSHDRALRADDEATTIRRGSAMPCTGAHITLRSGRQRGNDVNRPRSTHATPLSDDDAPCDTNRKRAERHRGRRTPLTDRQAVW